VDRATGLICDQTVILSGFYSHKGFPVPLRRIKYIVTTQRIPSDDPSVGDSGLGGFNQPLGLD
jgi:hypothetical protein